MTDDLEGYLHTSLAEMNYPVDGLTRDTPLGPDGVDVDSLARTWITLRISDDYGIELTEEEIKQIATLTIGELSDLLRSRIGAKG